MLLNPTVIIEVLSPSTEGFDRGEKFQRYRHWLPTLTDYVLVAQHQPAGRLRGWGWSWWQTPPRGCIPDGAVAQ